MTESTNFSIFGESKLEAPYNAIQVVNEFISRAIRDGITGMNPRKIQNLIYMAQGEFLALYDKSLIIPEFSVDSVNQGCFRANKSGPVHRGLKACFRHFVIDLGKWGDNHDYQELLPVGEQNLIPKEDEQALEVIDKVWNDTKQYKGETLVKWLKEVNTPWYKMHEKEGTGTGIPDRILKAYFQYLFEVHSEVWREL